MKLEYNSHDNYEYAIAYIQKVIDYAKLRIKELREQQEQL